MIGDMLMMRLYLSLCDLIKYSIIDEAMKRYIKPHQAHIGSLLAYFFVNYVLNGEAGN